jgi:hypothetical protein
MNVVCIISTQATWYCAHVDIWGVSCSHLVMPRHLWAGWRTEGVVVPWFEVSNLCTRDPCIQASDMRLRSFLPLLPMTARAYWPSTHSSQSLSLRGFCMERTTGLAWYLHFRLGFVQYVISCINYVTTYLAGIIRRYCIRLLYRYAFYC